MSELLNKISSQIEYYFGDVNLPRDKFLRDLVGKEDGWVPITTLFTFKRLKQLAETEENIIKAMENVKSELVELNETKDKIRRSVALPDLDDDSKVEYKLKTVHIKGFPEEGTTLDDCIEFCSQYGKVKSVQMKRITPDKKFKGCIFAIFEDVESANKAISSNDKFKGEIELGLRENKEQYFQRKKTTRQNKKDKLVKGDDEANENEEGKETEESKEESEPKYEKGCCVKLINVPEGTKFTQIRPQLTEYGNVQYVDLMPDTKTGLIRFASKDDADKALKAFAHTENEKTDENTNGETNGVKKEEQTETPDENVEANGKDVEANADEEKKEMATDEQNNEIDLSKLKKIKIQDLVLCYYILEGEEEAEYWKKVNKIRSDSHKNQNKFSKGKHNKNFNKKNGRFGKRKNNREDNDRFAKKTKSEN